MRVVVLGGTRFIGRAIVEELVREGHDVAVVHRGETEPEDFPDVEHVHCERRALAERAGELARFGPDAVVDCIALGRADAAAVLDALPRPDELRLAVLSSADVYRAYGGLHAGRATDALPLDESSPVREERYPYRGRFPDRPELDDYEKLEVEELYLARGATVLRLPAVFGEHDYQRREWFVLRRVAAGRRRIPIGSGALLFTRGYVRDVASGVRLAMESADARGEVFNLAERRTPSMRLLAERILEAAGAEAELVEVPDDLLPSDLALTGAARQHLLVSSEKARRRLGWTNGDPDEQLRRTVRWHLEHPPSDDGDFAADDDALAAAR